MGASWGRSLLFVSCVMVLGTSGLQSLWWWWWWKANQYWFLSQFIHYVQNTPIMVIYCSVRRYCWSFMYHIDHFKSMIHNFKQKFLLISTMLLNFKTKNNTIKLYLRRNMRWCSMFRQCFHSIKTTHSRWPLHRHHHHRHHHYHHQHQHYQNHHHQNGHQHYHHHYLTM